MSNLSQDQQHDIQYQLHSYTNGVKHAEVGPRIMARGEGIYVYDDKGNRYLEGMAGLWSVAVGFGEPRLVDAATRQLQELPYYHTFTHKSHPAVIELAQRLIDYTEGRMARAFFTNSGSEANDTVVKLVWYYHNALGRKDKKKIIARQRGYHGVTVASASLTGLPGNHVGFDLPLPQILHTSCPHYYRYGLPGETEEAFATRMADELEALILQEGPDTVGAFIGEPLMGAGGVIVPPRTYWQKIQAVCRKYDLLIIADEVITGFGRLGKRFGSEVFDIQPDMMVLSKQITSSYQPLGAVLLNARVAETVQEYSGRLGTFGHGYTASGHPVATAVALENLKIIDERGLIPHAAEMGEVLRQELHALADHPLVGEIRSVGLIAGIELVADKATRAPFDPLGRAGAYAYERAHEHGLILRGIQDTIAFCPPLIITAAQVRDMVARFSRVLDDTTAYLGR
ncbi:aminotransferase [Bordetella trematum]|uniref:Aminotransferase n=1 Tax=Bordetella trematum TaxID=123899 RepID=A0A157SNQ8_9BORD|nr:aspartate aminotransferase family protein [Bordetella trematum]AZR93872.1 aminotransferase [Bordetella trematum]NNH18999.1 aspartate aminotransferase family protein [Bordetella trematum]QIM72455.1 aspartate aminotransferase family protein [Bordetella trematum]SAI03046.1 aminotransferase [Bordetella trematum]SAI47533.1 aminotransferase [Bordetella trematum]